CAMLVRPAIGVWPTYKRRIANSPNHHQSHHNHRGNSFGTCSGLSFQRNPKPAAISYTAPKTNQSGPTVRIRTRSEICERSFTQDRSLFETTVYHEALVPSRRK
ncbi:unnamed protein product, partial [Nesidiocoris tenuis]